MASKTEWSNESLPPKKRELLQGSLPLEGAAPPLHGSPGPPSRAAGHGDGGREAQGPAAYADRARNSDVARRGFDFPGDADFCLKRDRASGDLACAYGGGRDGGAAAAAADGRGPLVVAAQGLEARREQNFGRGGPGTAEGTGGADPRGNGGRNARAPTAADEGRPSPAQRPLCRGTVLVSAPGATARTLSAPSSVAALGVVTSGPTPRSPPADAADLAGAARVHRRQEARPAGVAGAAYAEPGQDGRGAVRTQLPDVSGCRAVAPAPPPPPPLPPPPPPHLTRGAVIALASGELKRVEELSTEDFVRSARLCASVRVHASRVAAVQPLPGEPGEPTGGRVRLHFCLGERRGQVMLEVQAEHPFFVFGRGWASCEPALSLRLLGLACRQLCVGDMCVSLTTQPSGADDDTEHHHHQQQQQQQHDEEFHQLQLQQQHKKQHECQLHQQQQQQQLYHQQQHQLQQQHQFQQQQERHLQHQHQQQQQQERQLQQQQQQQQQQLQQLQQQNQQQHQQQQQERQLQQQQQQQQQQLQQQQQNQHLQHLQQQQQHLGWSRRVSLGAWERGHGGDDVPDGHGEGGGRGGLRGGWAVAPPQGNGAQPERRPGDHGARHSVTWQQQEADDDDDEDDEEDDDVEGLVEAAASCADEVTELSESRKRRRWSAPEGAGLADRALGPRAVPRHAPHRPGLIPHALKVSIEGRSTAGR